MDSFGNFVASVTHYRIGFIPINFTFNQVKSTLKLALQSSQLWIHTQFPIINCPFLRIFLNTLGNYATTVVYSGNLLLLSLIRIPISKMVLYPAFTRRIDPTEKTPVSLPLDHIYTLATSMSLPSASHHFNTREPTIPDSSDDDEEACRQQKRFHHDKVLPFLTLDDLAYQGYDTSFLQEDQRYFTATGAPLLDTAELKAKRREIHHLDKYSLSRLNT
jgi:hypothetical protein